MTSRSSSNSASASYRAIAYPGDGSAPFVTIAESPATLLWVDSVTFGENIPGWRDNLRNGLPATTSMVGTRSTVRVTNGLIRNTYPDGGAHEMTGRQALLLNLPTSPSSSGTLDDANAKALGKFAQRIYDAEHSFQGGVVVGELLQTLRMIRNPAQGLFRLVDEWGVIARRIRSSKSVRSIAFRKKKVAENLADAYLEAVFGWRPFLRDVDDGCKALSRYKSGQAVAVQRLTARGNSSSSSPKLVSQNGVSTLVWKQDDVTKFTSTVIFRGGMRLKARDPKQMDTKLFGFDPGSFIPTAWELIPYSFLVDYFLNIQEILAGWSTLFTELAWCNRTERNSAERTATAWSDLAIVQSVWPGTSGVTCVPAKIVSKTDTVVRAKYDGYFVPDLTFSIPGLGSQRWLNIAALILSRNADRKWSFD